MGAYEVVSAPAWLSGSRPSLTDSNRRAFLPTVGAARDARRFARGQVSTADAKVAPVNAWSDGQAARPPRERAFREDGSEADMLPADRRREDIRLHDRPVELGLRRRLQPAGLRKDSFVFT
jgi:hypothetical protein